MRLLGSLGLGVELLGLGREILVAVAVHDGGTNRTDRLLREVGRVGTHVGDVTVLVELLRGRHRARRRHAELAVGLLLHRAGGEGRIGRVLCLAPLHTLDGDGRPLECRSERLGCRAIEQQRGLGREQARLLVEVLARCDSLAIDGVEVGVEANLAMLELRLEVPVGGHLEVETLALPHDEEANGNALDAAGRLGGLANLAPEDGRHLEAGEPVEDAPRLLRVDPLHVELTRVGEGAPDGLLRDFVEDHPLDGHLGLELVEEVPADGLSLAVFVCRDVEFGGIFERSLELRHLLLLLGRHEVERVHRLDVDAVLRVSGLLVLLRHLLRLGDVADVALGCFDAVAAAKNRPDDARFRWGLHNHKGSLGYGHQTLRRRAGRVLGLRIGSQESPVCKRS